MPQQDCLPVLKPGARLFNDTTDGTRSPGRSSDRHKPPLTDRAIQIVDRDQRLLPDARTVEKPDQVVGAGHRLAVDGEDEITLLQACQFRRTARLDAADA